MTGAWVQDLPFRKGPMDSITIRMEWDWGMLLQSAWKTDARHCAVFKPAANDVDCSFTCPSFTDLSHRFDCRYRVEPERTVAANASVDVMGKQPPRLSEPELPSVFWASEPPYRLDMLRQNHPVDIAVQWHSSAHVFIPGHNNQYLPGGEDWAHNPDYSQLRCPSRHFPPKSSALASVRLPWDMLSWVDIVAHWQMTRMTDWPEAMRSVLPDLVQVLPDPASVTPASLAKVLHGRLDLFLIERHHPRRALAMWAQGLCNTPGKWRESYIEELMRYIHVDSYGNCLRSTKYLPREHTANVRGQYKFCLMFENERSNQWISEKVFQALVAGCVPVYYGAAKTVVQASLPCANCVVFAEDFSGPRDLAQYLIYLDVHDDAYQEFLAWKTQSTLETPVMMMTSKRFAWCGICDAVREHLAGRCVVV